MQKTENPRYIPSLQMLQHIIQLLIHVHAENGKPIYIPSLQMLQHIIQLGLLIQYLQKTENPRYIPSLQILQHIIQLLIHVHAENGKPTLHSICTDVTTHNTSTHTCICRKRKTHVTFHLYRCYNTYTSTHTCTCRKQKTHVTFHLYRCRNT